MPLRAFVCAALLLLIAAPAHADEEGDTPRSFTIAASGDVLIHGRVAQIANNFALGPAYDFTSMLAPIAPWVGAADLAICHLEGTISPDSTGLSYYPLFVAPREIGATIAAAGYDTCSTSSNHAMDGWWPGIGATLDVLDSVGIRHDGTARTPEERLPGLYEVNGVLVAHMSYTYGLNGLPLPADHPYAVNVIDADAILADAAWAREQGAEFVAVSLQWGSEYTVPPTAAQRDLAEILTASPDVDLILGSHAHVVQPIDVVNDKVVVYGLGNHLSNQNSIYGPNYYGTEDGVLVTVTVTEGVDGRFAATAVDFTPTWVRLEDYAVLSAADALATGAGQEWLVEASLGRTTERILMLDPPPMVSLSEQPWPEVSCDGRRATVLGTPGDDFIVGTPGDDVVQAGDGNDTIIGLDGNDLLCGGRGDDMISGGAGWDLLDGDGGDDYLTGGSGRDRLHGGEGADRLSGNDDGDALYGDAGDDLVRGDGGDDLLVGNGGIDRIEGGSGDDTLVGGAEGDRLEPGEGDDACRLGTVSFECG